jgi:hypothetical protein
MLFGYLYEICILCYEYVSFYAVFGIEKFMWNRDYTDLIQNKIKFTSQILI